MPKCPILEHYRQNNTRRTDTVHILLFFWGFENYIMHVCNATDYLFRKKNVAVATIYII